MTKSFFWLHIKKAGGTSFRKAFSPPYIKTIRTDAGTSPFITLQKEEYNDALNNYRIPLGKYDFRRALFAKTYLYSSDEFQAMYKFCIIRNPYRRIFSAWRYLMEYETLINPTPTTSPQYLRMKKDFTYFLEMLPEIWEHKNNRHIATHTAPIWPDITDEKGSLLLNEYYKLEELNEYSEKLCNKLGIAPRSFGQEKKSSYQKSANWFGKKSGDYSFEMKKSKNTNLIEKYFQEDLINLDYSIDF